MLGEPLGLIHAVATSLSLLGCVVVAKAEHGNAHSKLHGELELEPPHHLASSFHYQFHCKFILFTLYYMILYQFGVPPIFWVVLIGCRSMFY